MVLTHVTLHDLKLHLRADVPHDLPQTDANVRLQQLLAVFRDPHEDALRVKSCMRCSAVVLDLVKRLEVVT
jgi:hypothetical protein